MKKHPVPKGDLDHMEAALREKLQECADHINENYNVEGLHRQFPTRFQELVDAEGDRLWHH